MNITKAWVLKDEDGVLRPQAFIEVLNKFNVDAPMGSIKNDDDCSYVLCEITEIIK